jgi:hypothetical protein
MDDSQWSVGIAWFAAQPALQELSAAGAGAALMKRLGFAVPPPRTRSSSVAGRGAALIMGGESLAGSFALYHPGLVREPIHIRWCRRRLACQAGLKSDLPGYEVLKEGHMLILELAVGGSPESNVWRMLPRSSVTCRGAAAFPLRGSARPVYPVGRRLTKSRFFVRFESEPVIHSFAIGRPRVCSNGPAARSVRVCHN